MSLRLLSSLLVALALFFTPLAMTGDAAMAHGTMATASAMPGHCADQGQQDDTGQSSKAKARCMTVCAAVPSLPAAMAAQVTAPKAVLALVRSPLLAGIAPDRDTPPPRLSPGL